MNTERLDQAFATLAGSSAGSGQGLETFRDWLLSSDALQRIRINPYEVAAAYGRPLDEIVGIALDGVGSGLFDLHWLVHCPHCNMITEERENFFELTQTSGCKM